MQFQIEVTTPQTLALLQEGLTKTVEVMDQWAL